ncbi:MAG: polyprenyl synthetase family protein [Buchananella hordeovulneris]|nr:polyprenyl synthetase family protein [Buchananella hordeovulneris]
MTVASPFSDDILADLQEVEERLTELVKDSDAVLGEITGHLRAAGGKRMRPALTLLTARLGDFSAPARRELVMRSALAVELTHLATLYHDDVMDAAPVRRGAPTVHRLWGNSVAILAGDVLFARASSLTAALGPDSVKQHAETFERLCRGQLNETIGPRAEHNPVDFYLQVLADKTGSLVALAARYGAEKSGAAHFGDALASYGDKVGVAFQLADDVIDLSDADTGKVAGTDLREGVDTMPVLLLRAAQREGTLDADGQKILAALESDLHDDAHLASVVKALREHEVTARTAAMAKQWADEAVAELAELPTGEVVDALREFARYSVERTA